MRTADCVRGCWKTAGLPVCVCVCLTVEAHTHTRCFGFPRATLSFLFGANPVFSFSCPRRSISCFSRLDPQSLPPFVAAWPRQHARPILSVVKIILIYNGSHYKHLRKQRHGDGAQTTSQSRTVFKRSASHAESTLQSVSLLMWLNVSDVRKHLDWHVHICRNVCAFVHVYWWRLYVCGV